MKRILIVLSLFGLFAACEEQSESLPILGQHDYIPNFENGEMTTDTVFYTIPDFSFTNQNGEEVSQSNVEGKIYVTDFFFTSCPTICPKMSKNMLELAEKYSNNDRIVFLSHSIDTRHDSVPVLKRYSEKLNAPNNWHFVTGNKEDVFGIAEKYMVSAAEDEHAPGGVIHSGAFILLDGKRRIRAYYDGTKHEEMAKLNADIAYLLNEKL